MHVLGDVPFGEPLSQLFAGNGLVDAAFVDHGEQWVPMLARSDAEKWGLRKQDFHSQLIM